MTIREFVESDAGQGTLLVCTACGILAWPPALYLLVAAILLAFSFLRFREVFRRIDAELDGGEGTAPPEREPQPAPNFAMSEPAGHDGIRLPIRV